MLKGTKKLYRQPSVVQATRSIPLDGPPQSRYCTSVLPTRGRQGPYWGHHYGIQTPGGDQWWGRWVFRDIVEPEKLVFVMSFSDAQCGVARHPLAATWPLETLSTILFMEMGDKTLLTIKAAALNATETERQTFYQGHDSMRAGWGGTMEQLVAYLEEVQR